MTETESRGDRRSALDEFANAGALSPAAMPTASIGELTSGSTLTVAHGAVAVAVYRDESRVLTKLKALAAAAGQDWYYRFPVRNKKTGQTDFIEGPSIKLANDLSRIYGNCETDIRVQDVGEFWIFYARFIDLETGYALTRPFQQRKSAGKLGGDDGDRRLDQAFQIGVSKAERNVIVNALQTYADFAFEEAKDALVERIGKDLDNYRRRTSEKVGALVDIKRVEAAMGRTVPDWLAPDVAKVIAMMKAVQDGMATMDETFPPLAGQAKSGSDVLDSIAASDNAAAAGTAKPKGKAAKTAHTDPDNTSDGSAVDSPATESAAHSETKTEQLARLLKSARDAATCHQIWEQIGLDDYFNDDPFGRREAWKLMEGRIAELDTEGGNEAS